MSNVVPFNPAQAPAFARAENSAIVKALVGGGALGKRISIKGGVFRLVADGKEVAQIEDRHIDVVIVNAAPHVHRTYYAGEFVEGSTTPPACWSHDGEKPAADVKEPQSTTCVTCPMNAKGSGNGDSRKCRFSQRLAVVLANDMGGDVLQVSLPATSIFGKEEGEKRPLQSYARWLAAQNISPEALVTQMRFDTVATQPKLYFKPVRWLTDEEYTTCKEQGESADAKHAITLTVSQVDGVQTTTPAPLDIPGAAPKAAKAPKPPKEAKPAAPAPAAEPDEDEPTKRKEATPATAPTKSDSLAKVISNWDADDE